MVRTMIGSSLFAMIAMGNGAAAAQSAPLPDQAAQGPGMAGGAVDTDNGQIADIVVTATKRDERLQSVPIAITALSQTALIQSGIRETQDVALITPGLKITNQTGGLTPFIRGIGSNDSTAGQEPGIATYIDGVYQISPFATNVPLSNVERVEVLKGPQGTLFGRNASGGLVNIITKDPTFEPSADIRVAYGNYRTVETSAYVSGGLSDQVAANLSASYFNRGKGFGRNITLGTDTYLDQRYVIRGKLMFRPSDATEIKLTADYSGFQSGMGTDRQPFPGTFSFAGVTYNGKFFDTSASLPEFSDGHSYGLALHVRQEAGPFQIVSISAYRDTKARQDGDLDYGPLELAEDRLFDQGYRTFTQELQFTSNPGERLKWILGGFFMADKSGFFGPYGLGLFGPAFVPFFGTPGGGLNYRIKSKSYAAFGEATIPISDTTNLTVGGRYTIDRRTVLGDTLIFGPGPRLAEPLIATIPLAPRSKTFRSPTWRAIVDHQITPDMMIYASYSRGFKSGNFNTANPTGAVYSPEKVDTFEAGVKSELLGRRLRLNAAGFYNDYKNLQLTVFGSTATTFLNAPSARTYGLEVESLARITRFFTLNASVAYLHSRLGHYPNAICTIPQPASAGGGSLQVQCDATGNSLPKAPRFTFSIAPELTVPTGVGDFSLSATWYHSTKWYSDADNSRFQPRYDNVNARLEWRQADGPLTIAVFARNLTDEKTYNYISQSPYGDVYSAAPPRTYGAELRASF